MVGTKHIQENLVNDLEPDGQADDGSDPIGIEIKVVVAGAIDGEQKREIDQLEDNVGEKDGERAI